MTVEELIKKLEKFPKDYEVGVGEEWQDEWEEETEWTNRYGMFIKRTNKENKPYTINPFTHQEMNIVEEIFFDKILQNE